MALMWSEAFSVGISEIDKQHRELFARVNRFMEAMRECRGREEVGSVIGFLEDYVQAHFGTEERYMTEHDYPGYSQHKAQHEAFVVALNDIKDRYEDRGPGLDIAISIHSKLGDWLRHHIPVVDKKLASFVNGLQKAAI